MTSFHEEKSLPLDKEGLLLVFDWDWVMSCFYFCESCCCCFCYSAYRIHNYFCEFCCCCCYSACQILNVSNDRMQGLILSKQQCSPCVSLLASSLLATRCASLLASKNQCSPCASLLASTLLAFLNLATMEASTKEARPVQYPQQHLSFSQMMAYHPQS